MFGNLDYSSFGYHQENPITGNRGAIIEDLPATKREIEEIANLLELHGCNTLIYQEAKGTETEFLKLSGQNIGILHIASHGAFIETDENSTSVSMDNSFILLACSASTMSQGENAFVIADNNVVTAKEISKMELIGTELVSLSACETGLGKITSDGVFGLQRGFKKAGVNSILMSLWKVDDDATCKLMTEFYSNWIGKKMTKHDSLEAAKKTIRETKGWEDPKYWAAFILLDSLD